MTTRLRFDGWILGTGTTSGTGWCSGTGRPRCWGRSPVMVQRPDGHRVLLAPSADVAELVGSTYAYDEVQVGEVVARRTWTVRAGPLRLTARAGRRPRPGWLLRAVPPRLARMPGWVRSLDRPAGC